MILSRGSAKGLRSGAAEGVRSGAVRSSEGCMSGAARLSGASSPMQRDVAGQVPQGSQVPVGPCQAQGFQVPEVPGQALQWDVAGQVPQGSHMPVVPCQAQGFQVSEGPRPGAAASASAVRPGFRRSGARGPRPGATGARL